jgi:hypothetical protein
MNRIARSLPLLLVVASLGADKPLIEDYVKANVGPIPSDLTLDPFYKKHADALGIPVVSSEKVPDAALLVARDIIIHMLAKRPDLREAMVGRKMRVIVMARSESTTDLPEQKDWTKPGPDDRRLTRDEREHYVERIGRLTDKQYWDQRARGMGGNPTSCAEENLLGYPGTRYFGENIFVHEFAHGIMDIGIRRADPELLRKIRDAYKAAMDKGLWKGHYASTSVLSPKLLRCRRTDARKIPLVRPVRRSQSTFTRRLQNRNDMTWLPAREDTAMDCGLHLRKR